VTVNSLHFQSTAQFVSAGADGALRSFTRDVRHQRETPPMASVRSPAIHDFHPSLFIFESGSLMIETYLSETPHSSHFVHISDLPAFCYI
jgi:hypothetical protein